MMEKIRVGMVGAGFAADFHTEAFREVRGVEVEIVAVTSQREKSRHEFAEKHGIGSVYEDMCTMLAEEDDLDVVDLCVPTYVHAEYIVQAAQAGLDVIVEKPLTGYCGEVGQDEEDLIGDTVPKSRMMEWVLNQCEYIEMELEHSQSTLMYAENWVYAPSVQKARRLIESGSGPVMRMVAEESHSGSHASYAKYWSRAGGGSLLRTGSHPVGGVLYLKQAEGTARDGAPIRPKSVMADVGRLMDMEAYSKGESALTGDLADCEDWGSILITFEDGSVAQVSSSDVVLGGIYNYVKIFCSRGRIECNLNPNDQVMVYGPGEDSFGDEYIAEKLSSRAGWNFASPDEHWASGYPQEIQDFAECVAHDGEPLSGWMLARDVVAVIYAAYVSAEEGRRVEVPL
ncbi:MAG: gfo/Idh/MocA family oxidoreductase [Armatimonadia bacterium]|nr:gfo/Idh/MocA family oxidoreductase [Armatimonadia bacterium]